MIFNSVTYLLFLAVVVLLYWQLPIRPRLWLLFLSSLVFYGFWRVEFLGVMLLSVVTDYVAAIMIDRSVGIVRRRAWLLMSLVVNLGLLFYFKYLIFFAENVWGLAAYFGIELDPIALKIILPLGISFYTFQTISYTVDVYRGLIKPERDFVLYGCYVTYFPQLVAGPVLRAVEVVPQFRSRPVFSWDDLNEGVRRIAFGLFLKVGLADNIAPLVDDGYAQALGSLSALDVWTLAFMFGFQIYFDFSAYSHIALGSARLMGIRFPENFDFPYLATSPKDFWRRWHISLSSWIRDYLYLPLAGIRFHDRSIGGLGNATLTQNRNRALFLTWAIMGLWHGANWTFVVWGLYHACVITAYRGVAGVFVSLPHRLRVLGGIALTLPIMMLSWIPFRADTVEITLTMWGKVLNPAQYQWLGLRENTYLVAAILLLGMFSVYVARRHLVPTIARVPVLMVAGETLVFGVIFLAAFVFLRPIQQFIYFQF